MPQNLYARKPLLGTWLQAAKAVSPEIAPLLSALASTSTSMFRQWISGRRNLSADKAGALVVAMQHIAAEYPNAPAALTRADLCTACAQCPHYLASCGGDFLSK